MKKRRVILVDNETWGEIRVESLKRNISAGDYLVSCHNDKTEVVITGKPDLEFGDIKILTGNDSLEKFKEGEKIVKQREIKSEPLKETKKFYTEEHRKKNPSESCKICGKAIKYCNH